LLSQKIKFILNEINTDKRNKVKIRNKTAGQGVGQLYDS